MMNEEPLSPALNEVLQQLHSGHFPEERSSLSGEPWPPEIRTVIAAARDLRQREGPANAPLGAYVAAVLHTALWRHVEASAPHWTGRELRRQYFVALLLLEAYLAPVDRQKPQEKVLGHLQDEAYLRQRWDLRDDIAREVRQEAEQVSVRTYYRRRQAGIALLAAAIRDLAGTSLSRPATAGHVPQPTASLLLRTLGLALPPRQFPSLPDFFVSRKREEQDLLDKLLREGAQSLILWGPGGAGKTVLAIWAAQSLADRFPDGVIWVDGQPQEEVGGIQDRIARSLRVALGKSSLSERAGELRTLLSNKQCLLVLDGVWAMPDLLHLQVVNEASRLLITTRDAKVADILNAPLVHVSGLSEAEGLALLAAWAETAGQDAAASELVARLGGLPLALRLCGAQLRAGERLDHLLAIFRQEQVDLSMLDMDDPQTAQESLRLCFDLSYRRLMPVTQQHFARLGCFAGTFDETAATAVWGVGDDEAKRILKRLLRLALLEREMGRYRLHSLLRDYARQRLAVSAHEDQRARRRHAVWYIRHALYHPGVVAGITDPAPDLDSTWADVVAAVRWAVEQDQPLAAWSALLAHTERPALLKVMGIPLVEAVTTYLSRATDQVEHALFLEVAADLHLLQGDTEAALAHLSQAAERWQVRQDWLAASRSWMRMAGVSLLLQDPGTAAQVARQAQSLLARGLRLAPEDGEAAYWLFYWFDVIYNPLVRWEGLPEADVAALVRLAEQTHQPILEARALHVYRLWCTAKEIARSATDRERGRALALKAYRLWRTADRLDRADDEISFSGHLLNGRYSRRAAARYARRRSQTTPALSSDQIRLVRSEGLRWWLEATEAQRVAWLSRMLPRYLGASNAGVPALTPGSRAWDWVEDILRVGVLGHESRRPSVDNHPPAEHMLNGPEWQALVGLRPRPWAEPAVVRLVERFAAKLAHELDGSRVA